jgi:hypothetical protein
LVGAIDYFTKDIVLPLLGCGISPPDWGRSAVTLQFWVLFLWWRQVPIQVVEDMGSSFSGYGIQNPAQEASGLVGHADAPQGIYRIGSVSNPGIAVVPISETSNSLRQRGSGCSHHSSVLKVVQHLEGNG